MYGSKIAAIRTARGYTQKLMADKVGIDPADYSKIERDERKNISDELLQKIAEALGVSAEDIKSPTPIIMNFHDSPNNGCVTGGAVYNNINEDLLKQLTAQLEIKDSQLKAKDEQISQLLLLLNK